MECISYYYVSFLNYLTNFQPCFLFVSLAIYAIDLRFRILILIRMFDIFVFSACGCFESVDDISMLNMTCHFEPFFVSHCAHCAHFRTQ